MSEFEAEAPTSPRSRRTFLTTASSAALSFMIVPRYVLGGAGFIVHSERLDLKQA
jgi:hypothetical protein